MMTKISRDDLSQLLMVGFEGTQLSDDYYYWLREGLGGIILFSRNIESPEQLAHLTDEIQHAAKRSESGIPALIGTDQEGGRVFRLKEPFTHFSTARALGNSVAQTGSLDMVYQSARACALELTAMGIRLNFAPVFDVDSNPDNPIIGDRAFSSDPKEVARIASAYMTALQKDGVIACAKHFPGHGRTQTDSHLELPRVTEPLRTLQAVEFLPFEEAVREGVETIMPAHVLYEHLDSEWPATLSPIILQDWLRHQFHFDGVIISDDLEMKAISDHYEWREVVTRAINAGIDVLLICKKSDIQQQVMEALIRAVEEKEIEVSRIRESLKRIKKLKKKYLKNPRPFPQADWLRIVGCAEHKALVDKVTAFA